MPAVPRAIVWVPPTPLPWRGPALPCSFPQIAPDRARRPLAAARPRFTFGGELRSGNPDVRIWTNACVIRVMAGATLRLHGGTGRSIASLPCDRPESHRGFRNGRWYVAGARRRQRLRQAGYRQGGHPGSGLLSCSVVPKSALRFWKCRTGRPVRLDDATNPATPVPS